MQRKFSLANCQLAALLPQALGTRVLEAPQHLPAGIVMYSASYDETRSALSPMQSGSSLRGEGKALHVPLLNWIALQARIRLPAVAPLAQEFCLVHPELRSYLENARLFQS